MGRGVKRIVCDATMPFEQWVKQGASRLWKAVPGRWQWSLLWWTQPKFNVGVTGLVINPPGRVLLLKHVMRSRYAWGLPSGWLQPGETVEHALQREVHEEAALDITVEGLLEVVSGFRLRLEMIYACHTPAVEVNHVSLEIFEAGFFAPDALPAGLLPSHRRYIEQYRHLVGTQLPPRRYP